MRPTILWWVFIATALASQQAHAAPLDGLVFSVNAGMTRGRPRNAWYGVVSIGIPLDGAAATSDDDGVPNPFDLDLPRGGSVSPSLAEPPAGATDDEPAPRKPTSDEPAPPAPAPAPNPKPNQEPSGVEMPVRLAPAFVRRVVREALRARGLDTAEERLDSMQRRARSSAVLPEVRLRAARSTGESLRLSPTVDDPYRYLRGGEDELVVEARLAWRLDRLVFADDEVGIERARRQDRAERAEWVLKVVTVLLHWHRHRLRAANDDLLPEERAEAELDAFEAEMTLDVMTDGWFSGAIAQ